MAAFALIFASVEISYPPVQSEPSAPVVMQTLPQAPTTSIERPPRTI
jgi:hypothetical protein